LLEQIQMFSASNN